MNNDKTVFGVNFVDGKIIGYPYYKQDEENTTHFRLGESFGTL